MSLTASSANGRFEALEGLNRILAESLKSLVAAGEKERACTLAAEAWSLLRKDFPAEAQRMNALLHRFTSREGTGGAGPACCCKVAEREQEAAEFELDVRPLPPAQRHERIFEAYHKLQSGQGFILINDHDPKPLYYQFAFEYEGAFTWSPLEEGPRVWRIRIGKA